MTETHATPEQIVTVAQTDYLRVKMQEQVQDSLKEAQKYKKAIWRTLPWFVLSAGLVAIIPASVGATSGMGLLNTAVNFVVAWTLGGMTHSAFYLIKNRRTAKRSSKTAAGSDVELAQAVRSFSNKDALVQARKKRLRRTLVFFTGLTLTSLIGGVGGLVLSSNVVQTIGSLISVGIGIVGGAILLPGIRKDIRRPGLDRGLIKSLVLADKLQEAGEPTRSERRYTNANEDFLHLSAQVNNVLWPNKPGAVAENTKIPEATTKGANDHTSEDDHSPPPPRTPKM